MSLRPVKFKYTAEWMASHPSIKEHFYYNFIAQEYQAVFPNSAWGSGEYLENDSEEVLQIDTYNVQIVNLKATQELVKQNKEQQALIEQLQAENKILKAQNTNVQEQVSSLRAEWESVKSSIVNE